jgi:hypothetical protein
MRGGHFDCVPPARQERGTVLTAGSCFDLKSNLFQNRSQFPAACRPINSNHESRCGREEMDQPVQRRLERLDGLESPVEQRSLALAARKTASSRGFDTRVSAPMQLQHQLAASRPGRDDSLRPGAAREPDHRFADPATGRYGTRCLDHA